MTQSEIINADLMLIKNLIDLNALSISKAADVMNIQRTNLSSWLNGKLNVFSIQKIDGMLKSLGMHAIGDLSTGIRLNYLSLEEVHRWQVDDGATAFINVLRSTETDDALSWLEVFEVDALPKGCFNMVRRKSQSGDLIILVANRNPGTNTYPLSPEMLGFGKMAGKINVPLEKWIGWLKAKTLSTATFRDEILEFMTHSKAAETVDQSAIQHQLEKSTDKLNAVTIENVGLRAIIRNLLGEIRKLDSLHYPRAVCAFLAGSGEKQWILII